MGKQVKPTKEELLSSSSRSAFLPITGTRILSEEDRTVELSFSSDAPIEQWWRTLLVLEHTSEACNLTRLLSGGPLLFNHNRDKHIGVVVAAHVDADGKARATVKFGRSAFAEEKFQDVKDGILCNVSLGFNTDEIKLVEEREDGIDVYRATKWTPYEISLVTIPADTTVGVGRSASEPEPKPNGDRSMDEEGKTPATPKGDTRQQPTPPAAPQVTTVDIQKAERERIAALYRLGNRFSCPEDAETFVQEGRSVDQFNAFLVERQGAKEDTPTPEEINKPVGMSERELQQYSFLNAIRALQNPEDKKAQEAAALEREASQAAITGTGQSSRSGMVVPVDVLLHSGSRAMNASSAGGNGAALIATDLLHGSFIEMFQKKCFLMNVGTRLTGLVGNVAIPKQLSGATAYVVGVEEAPTASKGSFGQVPLDPKTIGTLVELERLFTKQSSIDAEALVRKMIADAMAYKLNHLALYADGSAKMPIGLKYIPGINAVSFASAGKPTFKEFVQLETEIAADDADVESMRYLLNARTRGYCKTAQKMDGTADSATIWENNGTVNGYQTITTNHVEPNDVFFGNFSDMLLGMWGGLDLTVDTTTKCDTGITRLVAFQDFDIAVRNAESFSVGTTAA